MTLSNAFAQERSPFVQTGQAKIDPKYSGRKTTQKDSNRVKILNNLSFEYSRNNPYKALEYAQQGLEIARKSDYWQGIAKSLGIIGIIYKNLGIYEKAINYSLQSLKIKRKLLSATSFKDEWFAAKRGIIQSLNNLGIVYSYQSNYEKSLDYFLQSLKIVEELLERSENHDKINLCKHNIAGILGNSGVIYKQQGKYEQALDHHLQCLKIMENLSIEQGIASSWDNIGSVYLNQGNIKKALNHFQQSLLIREAIGDKKGITISLKNIGNIYITQGNYEVAFKYIKRSLSIAEALGAKHHKMIGYEQLAAISAAQKKYKPAYKYHELYAQVKDSLFNEEKAKEIGKVEAKYEFEKKIAEEKARTEAEAKAEAERQKTSNFLQYSVIVIVIAVLLLVVFILGRVFTSKRGGRPAQHQRPGGMLPVRISKFLIFIIFLLLFEFILVLSDPFIEKLSEGAPLIKVLFNVIVATIFFPVHRLLETMLTSRIIKSSSSSSSSGIKLIAYLAVGLFFSFSTNTTQQSAKSIAPPTGGEESLEQKVYASSSMRSGLKDSLENLLKSAREETAKVKILNALSWELRNTEFQKALIYAKEALLLAIKLNDKLEISQSMNNMGNSYTFIGDYKNGLKYYLSALKIREEINNKSGIARSLNNIGTIYFYLEDTKKTIEYFLKSLKILEELNDRKGLTASLNNIGGVYRNQKKHLQAFKYFMKALNIAEEIDEKKTKGAALNNIAAIHYDQRHFEKALEYLLKSLKIKQETGDKKGMALSLNSLGDVYSKLGYKQKALAYHKKSLGIAKEIGSKLLLKSCYESLATHYSELGEHPPTLSDTIVPHYKAGLNRRDYYKKAYQYHLLYVKMKDSLFSEEKSKEIAKVEENYALEKKLAAQKSHQEELARIEAEKNARRDIMQYSGIFIFIVIFFVSLLTFGGILNLIPLWLINGLVFSAFLLFFEFMLVFLDPYIEALTGGAPALKLAINTSLASMIYPFHQFFEAKLKKRILKKVDN